MKKLWIFGDSFSIPYNAKSVGGWADEYIQWKGYVPKYFGDIIGEEMGLELKEFAIGGIDNDTIFETIIKQAPQIEKDDYVIVGWSSVQRFRLAAKTGSFKTFIPNFEESTLRLFNHISLSTIEEVFVNRLSPIYKQEIYNRAIFLNWLFRDTKFIQWTAFPVVGCKLYGLDNISKIYNETNNKIKDGHYSEEGNRQVAKNFIELFNDDEMRDKMNSKVSIPNNII
jgi:hypothetical protein